MVRPWSSSAAAAAAAAAAVVASLAASVVTAGAVAPEAVTIENLATASLTGSPGDPAAGREAFADRKLGNCLACHANADLSDELFHGEVGPALDGVGGRWSEEQLRAIVVNAKAVFGEQTIMPAFYSLEVGENVREDLVGQPILSAEQVEDIVAYLATLER